MPRNPRGPVTITKFCECGCGQEFTYTHVGGNHRRFIDGHSNAYKNEAKWREEYNKQKRKTPIKPGEQIAFSCCACGCGGVFVAKKLKTGKPKRFLPNHATRLGAITPDSVRDKISQAVKEKYKDPVFREKMDKASSARLPSTSPVKVVIFKGVSYRSTWEATRAAQLDRGGIPFEYEKYRLEYIGEDGKTHRYTPDFWLPTLGVFEEVKGFFREKDKDKMRRVLAAHPGIAIKVIQPTQEWGRLVRGEVPDARRVVEITDWEISS